MIRSTTEYMFDYPLNKTIHTYMELVRLAKTCVPGLVIDHFRYKLESALFTHADKVLSGEQVSFDIQVDLHKILDAEHSTLGTIINGDKHTSFVKKRLISMLGNEIYKAMNDYCYDPDVGEMYYIDAGVGYGKGFHVSNITDTEIYDELDLTVTMSVTIKQKSKTNSTPDD